jgi:ketosteroid isomerase-like protein
MIFRNQFLTIFLTLVSTAAFGQNSEKEINEQVWKPFVKTLLSHDVEGFMNLHSRDVMRVERDFRHILNYDQYKKDLNTSWPAWKQSMEVEKSKNTFELRFLERTANESLAFEVGYYKNELINAKGEKRTGYGQFHVALRKENGVWKILVDSDSNNNRTITEEMFQAAKALE